jgi:heme iron utilization protein
MSDDPHSRGGPPTYVQPGARTPSQAERARTLVHGRTDGALSTLALDPAGYPFGSIVTFALDGAGAPLILMSTMAEHARNLAQDPRASLLVTAGGEGAGRLAVARATLVGTVTPVEPDAQDEATAAYLTAHPGAFWARFPDFAVHRLHVEAIRYVRGFGEMSWVEPADYAVAEADPLAPAETGIIEHMNADHADAMAEMVAAFLEVDGEVTAVTMLACDRYGVELRLTLAPASRGEEPGLAFGRIGFDEPLMSSEDARPAMVRLTRAARATGHARAALRSEDA